MLKLEVGGTPVSRRNDRKRGFTLIEAVLAVFMLLLGVLFIFGMFPAGADAVTTARDTYAASEIAREKLEYWVQKGYTTISGTSSATLQSGTLTVTDQSNGVSQPWKFTYQVTHTAICQNGASPPCGGSNPEIAEKVEAYVSWQPKTWLSNQVEYVRLDTLVIQGWQTP